MTFLRNLWDRMAELMAQLVAVIVVGLTVFFGTILLLSKRWRRQEDAETMRRVQAIKEALAEARQKREAKMQAAMAEIDKTAAAQQKEDSVAVANRFILDGWDKK